MLKILSISSIFAIIIPFAQTIDTGASGPFIAQVTGAGAVVVVTLAFVKYITGQGKLIESLRDTVTELQKSQVKMQFEYQNHLDNTTRKFLERQKETHEFFEKQLQRLAENQNALLTETVHTVKTLESTMSILKNDIQVVLVKMKPKNGGIESSDEMKSIK